MEETVPDLIVTLESPLGAVILTSSAFSSTSTETLPDTDTEVEALMFTSSEVLFSIRTSFASEGTTISAGALTSSSFSETTILPCLTVIAVLTVSPPLPSIKPLKMNE